MTPLQLAKTINNSLSKLTLANSKVVLSSVRHHWNKDFKPGPYPKTEAERLAAAKRYGLDPSEYEPYRDDGTGYGDYPKFKAESGDSRDPFYPWDNPEFKRNYNENMHVQFDLIREDRYDVNARHISSCVEQYLQLIGTLSGFFLLIWIGEQFKAFHPILPKQMPAEGKKHYQFD
ncbi:NADH dehydrogenase [ubiquinone] 1 beta subcomplex subunit 8, mitochondrial [Coccinella septempunctata]|uniref:NADH dehydrogenase [ubiquinone] 1 beta subcomplex subunit 8, mitochondrial n=1 Tax=Coccinella septempunctata TaxID=41139 RepID=UPI001D07E2A9|nr:NADH dehydrogenase [ubiquinone] 1 beta subcomplex subunit 8, mitochondrial [Coccinella septempunctata]